MGRCHRRGEQHGALEGADPEWQSPLRCWRICQGPNYYQQALWLARQQFACWPDADEAVAALVVAHHNLADLLVAMTLPDRAADMLCHVHDCLLATSQSPASPDPLRAAALRHSRGTRTELLAFVQKHGHHDGILRCLGQCQCQTEPAHQLH